MWCNALEMCIVHAEHCISQVKPYCFTLRITYWLIVDGENENFDTVRAVSIWKMILKFSINHFTFQCFEFVNYSTPLWYSVMWIWAFFTLKIKIFAETVFAFFLLEFTASLFSMALPLVLSPTLRVVEMFSLLYEVCQVF